MDESSGSSKSPRLKTVEQVSAGGVALRHGVMGPEVAIIKTTAEGRWQLPKGIVDDGESPGQAALREVREEAGIECTLTELIDVVEFWFVGSYDGERKRYHKHVHFFLMDYVSGDVADHDHEVSEARWVSISSALAMLAFKDEKQVLQKAAAAFEGISANR